MMDQINQSSLKRGGVIRLPFAIDRLETKRLIGGNSSAKIVRTNCAWYSSIFRNNSLLMQKKWHL